MPPYPTSYTVLSSSAHPSNPATSSSDEIQVDEEEYEYLDEEHEEEHAHFLEGHTALKFLLAGGIAGAGMCFRTHTDPRNSDPP